VRLFVFLLFLKFLKKRINSKNFFLLKNANIMQKLKKFNLRFISYAFSSFHPFYFKIKDNFINFPIDKRNNFFFLLKKRINI